MTLRHVVTLKLASEDAAVRDAQAAEIARRLNALQGVVPQLLSMSAGANVLYPEANWDVTL
ncbi:MAG: Dabb family protein, partial [Microbacterium sp.]